MEFASDSRRPGSDQDIAAINEWCLSRAAPGLVVVVQRVQWGVYEYCLDEIVRLHARAHRIHLAEHGTFDSAGRFTGRPKGRFSILIPTRDVLHAAINGLAWLYDRPAYRRELSQSEQRLRAFARVQHLPTGNSAPYP